MKRLPALISRSPWARGLSWALLLSAAVLGLAQAQAGPVRVLGTGGSEDPPLMQVTSRSADRLQIEFTLPSLLVEDFEVNGETFQGVAIPRGGMDGEVGHPTLPSFSRFLAIPDRAGVQVQTRVIETEELDGYRLIPMQDESGNEFAYDAQAYSRNDFGNTATATVGRPSLLRDLRVVPLNVAPVQYNPAEGKLRVARRVEITVTFTGTDLENVGSGKVRPIASSFDRLYRELVVNYDSQDREVLTGAWLLITPNDTNVLSRLQPLVNWRQRKGFPVVVATTAETGTTALQIKAYIQNAYDHWAIPPEYIVLAGDATAPYAIPTWFENVSHYNGEGDHPYAQLAGGDILADANVGRLSFNTLTELETIVAKIVGYESTPSMADPSWFTRGCVVGDPSNSGYSCVQVMQTIKTRLLQLGYAQVDTVFQAPFVSQMQTALNRGDSIFSYRGYLNMSGWSNSNTNSLTNGWKMPFAVISTCGTGSFAAETSPNEAFLRAGSATTPRAAVAATGTATWGTNTRFNNCYIFGVMGGLLWGHQYNMGAAHTRGKTELYLEYHLSYDTSLITAFSYWNNLMGDPATECWTGAPAPMSATTPAELPVGANSLVVNVSETGGAAAGATVCAWKTGISGNETYVSGTTDGQGRVELPISLITNGTLLLTVTKHDRQPILLSIPVNTANRFVGFQASTINDDAVPPSSGDGNSLISPTESIELPVQLKNFGSSLAPGVTATLTTDDPYVSGIQQGAASFGDLAGSASAWGDQPYVFTVAPTCPEGHVLRFGLDVTSLGDQWRSVVLLTAHSSDLGARGYHWTNAGPGGILDPGETVQVSIGIKNFGTLAALAATAHLTSLSRYVSVINSTSSFGDIPVNGFYENISTPFTVAASANCFNGHIAPMRLVVTFNNGRQDTCFIDLPVGTRTSTDPTGPDAYGYLAFEDTDLGYPDHPTYSWVEIDPTLGGSGAEIVLGDNGTWQDKTRQVPVPFPIPYYGQTYSVASVCSNGWIVMGPTYLTDYRNWTLPSPGGPSGVIAAYWDDIYQSGPAKAYQYYDNLNHRWIVEWSRFRNAEGDGIETFEILFYDPSYYPTETGDAVITFQYLSINNPDGTDGFATIGIEKPDNTDGVLYTYFNNFTPGSTSLVAGRAIRFVPKRADPTGIAEGDAETSAPTLPARLALVPNPLHQGDLIRFSAERAGKMTLTVHDVQGRMVRRLFDGSVTPGTHTVRWNGMDEGGRALPSGIYFYRVKSGERLETDKIVVIR